MPRLPEELIQQIKQEVDLVQLIQSQGYELKKNGKDYRLSCPWHDDTDPSLVVSPDTNLWHCMGACQTGGSVIDWVMKTQGVSFRLACEILQKEQGLITRPSGVKRSTTKKLPTPLAANADNQKCLQQVVDYYHDVLKQSPEALDYLEKRGLNSPELINTFKLGYANRTLGYRLPDKNRQAGAKIRGQLKDIGILRQTGHEHFSGSLVVPVIDEQGQVRELYGRKILGKRLRQGTAQHLYLPGSHDGVWNIGALKIYDEMIICEALIDAMTFWVHGFKHVTSSYGALGFTHFHLAAFKQHQVKRVLIAYDRDGAGNAAAEQLAEKLLEEGIECFRIQFPKGMDVNEYSLKMSPANKSLELVIRKAQWMGAGDAQGSANVAVDRMSGATETPTPLVEPVPAGTVQKEAAKEKKVIPPLAAEPPSSPVPALTSDIEVNIQDHEIQITLGERHYRIRGLSDQTGNLKINLMLSQEEGFHTDKLDLYSAKQRTVFINQASDELGIKPEVIKKDLGKLLLKLEEIQQAQQCKSQAEDQPEPLSIQEREAALALLGDKHLVERITQDFIKMGIVGESSNTLVGYLGCVSRQLNKPLAVMIQSSSAAGKSSLMEAILALMPENERVQYSAMTGQSLFYLGETSLQHKILAISEEEGASNASYALKLLQSEGEVTIASTGKDNDSGQLVTQEYTVKGPTMLFMTTTAIDIDEELLNRCLVLSVNESREQTQAIHELQRGRRTLAGLENQLARETIMTLHRHAQQLLRPLTVINPYADQLTFISNKTRTRRDHEKYLTLIDCIALLHQYQREVKILSHQGESIEYIEVGLEDIALANQLANEVLGRTLDELPPQTRKLLTLLYDKTRQVCEAEQIQVCDYRFSRRDVLDVCGWSYTQVRIHMDRLVDMEYLLVHQGGRGQRFEYELIYDGQGNQGDAFVMGLLDIHQLTPQSKGMTKSSRGDGGLLTGSKRPHNGGITAREKQREANGDKGLADNLTENPKSTYIGKKINGVSYHNDSLPSLAAKNPLNS